MNFEYAVDNGDVAIFDFEDDDVTDAYLFDGVVEEQDVASLEGWFHGSREDNYDG